MFAARPLKGTGVSGDSSEKSTTQVSLRTNSFNCVKRSVIDPQTSLNETLANWLDVEGYIKAFDLVLQEKTKKFL